MDKFKDKINSIPWKKVTNKKEIERIKKMTPGKAYAVKKALDKHRGVELTSMLPKSKKKLSFKDITRDEDATMNWNREGKQNVK